MTNFSSKMLGKTAKVKVDRPLGSWKNEACLWKFMVFMERLLGGYYE